MMRRTPMIVTSTNDNMGYWLPCVPASIAR